MVFTKGSFEDKDCETDILLLTKSLTKDIDDVENMRPISIIKFMTKWVLSIVAERMQKHVLSLTNYAFMKGRGTIQAGMLIRNAIEKARLLKKRMAFINSRHRESL